MKRRRKDSGFAMMLVVLMAASIAITLYMEIPRIAFEAERQHELLLVDRGNQFKRAIQVFITDKTNNPMRRWPASLDELESFNNHRYLRRRYVDPMTGKDEWRLIHINGGVLTDSVTNQKPAGQNGQSASGSSTGSSGSTYLSTQAYMDVPTGDDGTGGASAGVNRALNRRPSETAGAPGDLSNPGGAAGNASGAPPAGLPGMPGAAGSYQPPGMPGQPGFPGQAGMSGGLPATAPPSTDPSTQPAGGGYPGVSGSIGAGGPGTPGMPGGGQNPQSSAAGMINNLLTTPRPGGMPTNMPGSTIGGGIAGVASKFKAEGIMVINERTKINEWEFLFDLNKYRPPPNPIAGAVGTPQQQQNGTGNSNNGMGSTTTTNGPGGITSPSPIGH